MMFLPQTQKFYSLQTDGVDLLYFNLRLFDLT